MPEIKNDVPDAIRISYGVWDIDITRSVDLTLDSLKAEVARLMWCDPSQLTVVASATTMNMGRAPELSEDNALTLYARYIRFGCDADAESKNDAMEDVQYNQAERRDSAVHYSV
jgi:hypothetical protein